MARQPKELPIDLDAMGERLLSTLLANLLSEEWNDVPHLPFSVTRLVLADRFHFFSSAFQVIEELSPMPCSAATLATTLQLRGIRDADERVQAV